MEDLRQDMRYAFRTLTKKPVFTTVVILTLALGIGANTAIFSLINQVLLRPIPILDSERVAEVYTAGSSGGGYGSSSYPDYVDFRDNGSAWIDLAAYLPTNAMNLSTQGESKQINVALVSGNYFNVLGVLPAVGRVIREEDDLVPGGHAVIVLSYDFWQERFGGRASIVGESMTLNGAPYTVLGVAAAGFDGTLLATPPEAWIPLKMVGSAIPFMAQFPIFDLRNARWLSLIGRLHADQTVESAQSELNVIMARLADEYPQSNRGTLIAPDEPRPIQVAPVAEAAVGGGRLADTVQRARILLATVGIVLLIACANVANMLLGRAQMRQREMAVRLAIGAGRGRLMRQLLTENSMFALGGGALGLVLAWWVGNVLLPLGLPSAISRSISVSELTLDIRVLAFAILLSLITAFIFGIVPALRASRPELIPALKNTDLPITSEGRRVNLRDALVVVQIASSVVLLVGAGLFLRSLQRAYTTELGFDPRGVLLTTLNPSTQGMSAAEGQQFFDDALERVSALPGVEAAAIAAFVPVQIAGGRQSMLPEGYQPRDGEDMELSINVVTPGYFRTIQTPIVHGEAFGERHDGNAPQVVVVNQTFADRFWPGEDALGRRIQLGSANGPVWAEVIGVAENGKYRNIREDPIPYVYFALKQQPLNRAMILAVRSAGEPAAVLPAIRSEIHALDPTMPITDVHSMRAHLGIHLQQDRATALLVGVLGALALMVAAVGVYGVISYAVSRRTQEIGIRTALGASGGDVLRLVVGRGMALTLIGVTIGAAGALALGRFVASLLFGVTASDPLTFAGVIAVLATVSATASYLPARRAARVDPLQALRYE